MPRLPEAGGVLLNLRPLMSPCLAPVVDLDVILVDFLAGSAQGQGARDQPPIRARWPKFPTILSCSSSTLLLSRRTLNLLPQAGQWRKNAWTLDIPRSGGPDAVKD